MTSDSAVHAVLRRWFPGCDITIERAGSGISTPVFAVCVDGEVFYARLAEDPGERRDAEVAVHRRLVNAGVPVPAIVRYEAAPSELDRSLALTTRVPGVSLAGIEPGPRLPEVARAAGEALARVNAVPVRGYGWVQAVADDGMLLAEHPTRHTWAGEYLAAAEDIAGAGVLDRDAAHAVREAVRAWADLPDATPSHLAHGDFDATHVYVDPDTGAFTGIIDFGEIRGADRLYDLGHLLLHDGEGGRPPLLPDVLQGYERVQPLTADARDAVRLQSIAIAARALAIQLRRPPSGYRVWLARRLGEFASGT